MWRDRDEAEGPGSYDEQVTQGLAMRAHTWSSRTSQDEPQIEGAGPCGWETDG